MAKTRRGQVPIDPSTEKFPLTDDETKEYIRNSSVLYKDALMTQSNSWKVLPTDYVQQQYPADPFNLKLYAQMLHQAQNSDEFLHVIFLNQAYHTPFFAVMDSASDKNVIHPACVAMMLREAPWAVRVIEHPRVTAEGISTEIQVEYNRTCVIRINHQGKPHLVDMPIIDDSTTLLIFGKPFFAKFDIHLHSRPQKVIAHDVQSLTVLPYGLKEALDFKTIPSSSNESTPTDADAATIWTSVSQMKANLMESESEDATALPAQPMRSYASVLAGSIQTSPEVDAEIATVISEAKSNLRKLTLMGFIQRENLFRSLPDRDKLRVRKLFDETLPISKAVYKKSVRQVAFEEFQQLDSKRNSKIPPVKSEPIKINETVPVAPTRSVVSEPIRPKWLKKPPTTITLGPRRRQRRRSSGTKSGIPVHITRPFEVPARSAQGVIIKNPKVPDGTYIFSPTSPMINDMFTPHCLVAMRSGRGFIQLLNATSKWKCVPKIRRLGTLEPAPFSDAEIDEKLLDVATEEEI
ncbi:MAG: hypothetical protein ACHQ1H_02850 [Nitrososphaerales archaeon]